MQLLVGGGEALVLEEGGTALLDHVLQRHEAGVVPSHVSLKGRDGCSDGFALLAGWPRLGLGTNEPCAQDRQDLREDLLARGLGAQEATDHLRLAAPLPTPMGLRAGQEGVHVFPGGTRPLGGKLVETRPEGGECQVDDRPAAVEEPQRILLGRVGQAEVIAQGLRAACAHQAAPVEQGFADCPHDTISAPSTASK